MAPVHAALITDFALYSAKSTGTGVKIEDDCRVEGGLVGAYANIDVGKRIQIGTVAKATGLAAGGTVSMDNKGGGSNSTIIYGCMTANGTVTLAQGSIVTGSVDTSTNVNADFDCVTVQGNVTAGTGVAFGKGATIGTAGNPATGTIDSGAAVTIDSGCSAPSHVYGNITAVGNYTSLGGRVTVDGTVTAPGGSPHGPATLSAPTLPDATTFTTGGVDLGGGKKVDNQIFDLDPDPTRYGKVKGDNWNTIIFHAGDYYIDDLQFNNDTDLKFDLSGGAINVFANDMDFGKDLEVYVSTDGINYNATGAVDPLLSSQISFEVRGDVKIKDNAQWFGRLFVPFDKITFETGPSDTAPNIIGSLWAGDTITLKDNNAIHFVTPDPAAMVLLLISGLPMLLIRRRRSTPHLTDGGYDRLAGVTEDTSRSSRPPRAHNDSVSRMKKIIVRKGCFCSKRDRTVIDCHTTASGRRKGGPPPNNRASDQTE